MFGWLKRKPSPATGAAVDPIELEIAAGDAAREGNDRRQAIAHYAAAHKVAPGRLYPIFWLCVLHEEEGELELAREFGARGLALDPDQIGLHLQMGNIAHALRDPATALTHYQHVARLDPTVPGIDALLADQLCYMGKLDEGVAAFDRALAKEPDSLMLQQNRLFCLNYSAQLAPSALAELHREWARAQEARVPMLPVVPARARGPAEKLRIGYVSSDLRDHAVASFLVPLLEHHDRSRFHVVAFDTSQDPEDAMASRLRNSVAQWRRVADMTDDALADAIRGAGIDILVDLSGHTRGNRLLAFARRPAPVQVTWLGYLATTGMTRMDYRLTDAHMDPPGMTESLYTEQLVRLPIQACFEPWPNTPPVAPSQVAQGAPLTFGSVNQWPKVSEGTKDVWASLLNANPAARLLVVARGGHNPLMQRAVRDEFARRGVRAEQIEMFPFMRTDEFLAFLGRIDIALDPFPYGGGTTTFQCLWMGVPVVTLAGDTALSRNAIGPLVGAGLSDLVATSREDYVEIATRLGRDTARLAALRSTLRDSMARSPLMDGAAFARAVEAAYVAMWRRRGEGL